MGKRRELQQILDDLHARIAAAITWLDDAIAQVDRAGGTPSVEEREQLTATLSRARARLAGDQLHRNVTP